MTDLFSGIITSKIRVKLLIRFFFNPEARAYLRELAKEFDVSTNAVRGELNQLTTSQLLVSQKMGRQVYYQANREHPLFPELKSMVSKLMGIDRVIEGLVNRLGELELAYILDDYAQGKDTGIIDLLLIGRINNNQLSDLTQKTERYIRRKIRTLVMSPDEYKKFEPHFKNRPRLLIWESDEKSKLL